MTHKLNTVLLGLLFIFFFQPVRAQWAVSESVLSDHTWYKIGVVEDGVYALDGSSLQSLGVNTAGVDPSRIRLYGNAPGCLPESNSKQRYDDLTEIAIQVTGAEDGTFDAGDEILFYGYAPLVMELGQSDTYNYVRNPYTDTTYYFLCLEGEQPGLRIQEKNVSDDTPVTSIHSFRDYVFHESEEMSPYASGRTWYGDLITPKEGFKEFSFDVPDLDTDQPLDFYAKVMGRCTSRFGFRVTLNDELVGSGSIKEFSSYVYGIESELRKELTTDRTNLLVRVELDATTANPMLFTDYVLVNYWRRLRLRDHALAFRLVPSQLTVPSSVVLDGVAEGVRCWDVTNPLRPAVQPLHLASGQGSFVVAESDEQRYFLFDGEGMKQAASFRSIPNQNLHGIADAELLIFTPRVFWEPSEALADFHREHDGMRCELVDIDAVYNEFGTGAPDPTALRDFIRMVYLRSGKQLKYVLLMGKGTHDYRDIKGRHNNFVPTFELLENPLHEVYSLCTDDYFALMDLSEGEGCQGRVDLGVGRLPVVTVEQAADVVEKIKRYADPDRSQGAWKNEHLFLADNDSRTYINYVEYLDKMLDTAWHVATAKKLYVDSYPLVTTASGTSIPGAHDALVECFQKGFGVMSYTGHGGVKGLMEEKVLTSSDILAMNNAGRLPFVHTSTCEFSKFDNPNVTSAGEMMVLNPEGGAIAMLTTIRPTLPANNQEMSKSFHTHVYERDGDAPLRFGDIVQRVKADPKHYSRWNLCFVFFGDPALRFANPLLKVATLTLNGGSAENNASHHPVLSPSSIIRLEGEVRTQSDVPDTLFNGVMEVRLYDKKSRYTTLGAFTNPMDYEYYHDVLFEGEVSVTNGRFTVEMPVPATVNTGQGLARVSYYAYDSIRKVDASGVFDAFTLDYSGQEPVLDQQGPEVTMYWNSPDFHSGDVVSRNGVLYVDLFDEQGIYHYNFSIGRNIMLKSNAQKYNNVILNDYYEPRLDDYRYGRIVLPVKDLDEGTYEFQLRVWDTQDNATDASIVIVIEEGVMLARVFNYPNPFSEGTYFSFMHGDMTEDLSVQIEVYDVLGRPVAGLQTRVASLAGVVSPIYWDGSGYNGTRLHPGLYVYRMTITDSKGRQRAVSQRMVVE